MSTAHRPLPARPASDDLKKEILEPDEWLPFEPLTNPHRGPERPETEEEIHRHEERRTGSAAGWEKRSPWKF
ncbi:hypothetical protein Y043_6211 [Burkholderia pseudomallei MSHR2138]|nr:hypothetical protein Y043_6211 [Burkholderia pseudomallei MSHR2138]